ncbi:MAG: isoprenylcysteine carboxylmethyltransferase family protein [Candidatus Omnitrophica bacterium]|nr:isoprenylcysteine carboxylmethyltransferase family protein [Candidatus Omnitrophota bacterium]
MKKNPFSLIKLFIILGNIGVPGSAVALAFFYPEKSYRWLFAGFVVFHALERVWETFYTSKEKRAHQIHGDWTLALVSGSYITLCFLFIFEFFLWDKSFNLWMSLLGIVFYLAAFRLRWWGMSSLGSQWSIHAVGAIKLKNYRLLRVGAYHYIRHPVYLGIMIEEISLPLIANAYWALIFALAVCIPLVIIRARFEERSSLRKFGRGYASYMKQAGMFFPKDFFKGLPAK